MENYQNEYNAEIDYLSNCLLMIKEQLLKAEQSSQKGMEKLIESRKDMQDNTVFSNKDFDRIVDIIQYLQSLREETSAYDEVVKRVGKLRKMLYAPYFARVDFLYDGDDEPEKIYIGKAGFTDEKSYQYNIYDWRAPVSSLFYRFEAGKADFEAPSGTINGEITQKRQYEIANGKLEYFFDADVQIVDEFLRKLLSQNASIKMKTIVETIQRDQDMIIRDVTNELLMVQGAAGSGKTSVALHRAAYLMYQGLSSKLTSNNILVLSPNKIFEKYISDVLPELGEDNVCSVIFEDICKIVLKNDYADIQYRNRFFENMINCSNPDKKRFIKESLAFKSSENFAKIIDIFIKEYVYKNLDFTDIYYDDKCIVTKEEIIERIVKASDKLTLEQRLNQAEKYIFQIVRELRPARREKILQKVMADSSHMFDAREYARLISINESTELYERVQKFTSINYRHLYQRIFQNKDEFYRMAEGIDLPECIDEILDSTLLNLKSDMLQYEDSAAMTFMKIKLSGVSYYQDIHQVIIDEAQDYFPVHFEILRKMFPNARYTILGDFNQTIEKQETLAMYDMIQQIFQKKKSTLIKMYKSFRSTNEIIEFSRKFMDGDNSVENFSRFGETPVIYSAQNDEEYLSSIVSEIEKCVSDGYGSIGVICKSDRDSVKLFEKLSGKVNINRINHDSLAELKGNFIIPVYMAKGLEFDAVLLVDADDLHYNTEDDKKLLYVACTRALHRLNLFHTGKPSRFLEVKNV